MGGGRKVVSEGVRNRNAETAVHDPGATVWDSPSPPPTPPFRVGYHVCN